MRPGVETPLEEKIEEVLAEELHSYLASSQGDKQRALELYAFNMRVCEALYPLFHLLEVTSRSRFSTALSTRLGAEWFDHPRLPLSEKTHKRLLKVKEEVLKSAGAVKSSTLTLFLPFAFWVELASNKVFLHDFLWTQIIHPQHQSTLTRAVFLQRLYKIQKLRNSVMHHRPVWYWGLPQYHADILEATRWLSPKVAAWSEAQSRFNEVWKSRPSFLPYCPYYV